MPHLKPKLTLGRPIREPATFQPTAVWTEGDYLYRYDAKRKVCRRSPVKPGAATGTMFFTARPAAAKLARKRPPKLVMAGLWTLFVAAAMVFVYPLWPAAAYQWQQLHPSPAASLGATTAGTASKSASGAGSAAATAANVVPITDNRVIIPKIGVNTPIVEGSNLKILDKAEGVWHQTGSVAHGNFVLAGHRFRYLPPNTSTLYNLDKLAPGDAIAVDWLGKRTVYQVTQMEIVPQNDVAILDPTASARLTLYSCNDIRQTQRVVAIAEPLPAP
jgi:LPXTG-site transpeptidase (sortase) family protein